MRVTTLTWSVALGALFTIAPLAAQEQPVVSPAELDAALEARASGEDADRALVRRTLDRPEVAPIAERMGVDLDAAKGATSTLTGSRLARAVSLATGIEQSLAGGQNFVISATTLIIVLLLVILIILIAS